MMAAFRQKFLNRPGLTGRMIVAGSWNILHIFGINAIRLASNLIMTRLLMPEAFGLMAFVAMLLAAFELLSDVGLRQSIVREKDGEDPRFLRVAWVVKILRGSMIAGFVLVSALLLWLLGPLYAAPGTVYADPRLPVLIAFSALVPILQGAQSTKRELAMRGLNYRRVVAVGLGSRVFGLICMVLFAQINANVWTLFLGMMMSTLAMTLCSHLFLPGPRMKFVWDKDIADRLWQYGKFLMGSSMLTFLARNMDKILLGGFLGAATFGIYTIAVLWIEASSRVVRQVADRVGFPALAEVIRDRPKQVPRLFRKFQTVVDLVCVTAFLGMFLLGEVLIQFLYTETYWDAGGYLKILSVSFLVLRFQTLNGLMMNVGNSRGMMIVSAMRAAAICVTIPLGFHLGGLQGALLATAMTPAVSGPYTILQLRPVLGKRQTNIDLCIWAATLIVGGLVYALS